MTEKDLTTCPSNLKEAIDWILRVTGKDGQGGRDNTAALANAVKGLLEAELGELDRLYSEGHANRGELNRLKQGLTMAKDLIGKDASSSKIYSRSPIAKLAIGLSAFIGYTSNGVLFDSSQAGTITGAGIAPSDIVTHRLCDATIAFTIGVLEECKKHSDFKMKDNQEGLKRINKTIENLHGIYGGGPAKLQEVGEQMKTSLNAVNASSVRGLWNSIAAAFVSLGSGMKDKKDQPADVADKVGVYLTNVLNGSNGRTGGTWSSSSGPVGEALKKLVSTLSNNKSIYDPKTLKDFSNTIKQVETALKPKGSYTVNSALTAGVSAFITHLKAKYESAYQTTTATWQQHHAEKCAKIFLGCLPLLFNGLCYLYWGCDPQATGQWSSATLGGGSLRDFMLAMSYGSSFLNGSKRGTDVTGTTLKKFADLKDGMQKAQQVAQARASNGSSESSSALAATTAKVSYSEFLSALKQKGTESSADTSLSALYYCASCYFKSFQIKNAKHAETSPSTIREMLYFLAALPFSPDLGGCENYLDTLLSKPIPVAITHSPVYYKLTAANVNSTLTTSVCLSATTMLGRFQGPGYLGKDDDPFLHNLYCNGIGLKYPSGSALFHKLTDCVYAIQFQMNFLLQQCRGKYSETRGWRDCRFGKEIEPTSSSSTSVLSHICRGYTCEHTKRMQCQHNGTSPNSNGCTHNVSNSAKCGQSPNPASPLQAFLTDKLDGFHLPDKTVLDSTNHFDNHPPGAMCHVKMGFQSTDLRDSTASKGAHITATLLYICANVGSPFRQFCENMLCLTKRTPRILGEFFGFYWQIVTVKASDSVLTDVMAYITETFLHNNEKVKFIKALSELNGSKQTHVSYILNHSAQADLMSLYYPECSGENCGPYLLPLVYSAGATFSLNYASTYLSWVIYLADDFRDWLIELLGRFDSLKCTNCNNSCQPHSSGSHATTCRCPSITQCADVLPLYYEYGFTTLDPKKLKEGKKTCSSFHSQLSAVINGDLYSKALSAIDDFLFLFRFYFFYNLSSFWTIYICLIMYTFFFLLDTLHLRSHVKLTASYMVPSLTLLTSGKPLPITKLTYITQ
ncbi:variant erythrocyte surface antigen-1 family protein [Babesia caballi]|uniref:Variant erythrocyte surface antigen-1 family protein n=1 Tax=Babesia caballi TaxID=5871 RepID=A0AAV4LT54_BABCB|nr:variant erythrocyte surface antigen-1 family protein [Babesia caballi]